MKSTYIILIVAIIIVGVICAFVAINNYRTSIGLKPLISFDGIDVDPKAVFNDLSKASENTMDDLNIKDNKATNKYRKTQKTY
jgi:hypothetical protein